MKLYLAHPFDSRNIMRSWQRNIEKELGIQLHNPFYDTPRDDIVKIDEGRQLRYEKLDPFELVPRDIVAIAGCDGIVAHINGELSYGTIMEIVYGNQIHGRDNIYIICTNGHASHPWLQFHGTVFTCTEDFVACMVRKIN